MLSLFYNSVAQLILALSALILLNCNIASAQAPDGKSAQTQSTVTTISNIYSDINMQMQLAIKPNAKACSGKQCALNRAFDTKVQQVGERLALIAYKEYPDLMKKSWSFSFEVVEIKEFGMASNAAGKIVIFRGIQHLGLSEDAIEFILAREMGHVIGRHHDENITTKMIFSVLTSIFFPAITPLSASNFAAQVSTNVASSVTSYFGSEAVISKIKPSQLTGSDEIAIALLEAQGWEMRDVEGVLRDVVAILQSDDVEMNSWLKDLHTSVHHLNNLTSKADADSTKLKANTLKNKTQ